MNRIITLFLGLFLTINLFGQSKVDYDNDSRWFWTANLGTSWTTTDVLKKHDLAGGLTIGKSFNYYDARKFSFDIRGRYLTGKWYGQEFDSTNFEHPNAALSNGKTNYDSVMGFGVLNHQTRLHELSLELVIHANNLRAKTGWDLFVFGGIGYTWYNAKGNLLGSNDSLYRYDQLTTLDKGSVNGLLDGSYESQLDGSSSGSYNGAFMPSVGFGIGYQVGPRFSIGLEHKTTFTLLDNFDGYVNPKSKYNDIYHYTSAYLRFQIRDHRKEREVDNSLGQVDNYDQTTTNPNVPPVVDFRNPATSGTTVNSSNYVIRADIRNVAGSNNVIFRQNGNYNTSFTFNPSTQQFESTVSLQPGQNVFELTGTNNYGSDQETTIIIYNRELQNPPVVTFVNPSSSPVTVNSPAYNLSATVINVTQQSQVEVKVNGQLASAFTFNPSNNLVSLPLTLQMGTNIITVTGTNQYGSDSESTTIIYRPQQTEQPPVVYYVDPNVNPYTTSAATFTINADVLNVAGSQNITFKQNGNFNQNFTYNASTDDFQSSVVLNPGQNVFEIIATNSAGTAQATTIIIYERQAPKPPVVTITNPSVNPQETSSAYYTLGATVLNVMSASQIALTLNGTAVTNFTYTPATSGVIANLNLVQGANIVTVTGTNNDGTDSKQTTIIYRPVQTIQPPAVVFTNPNVDPYTSAVPDMTVTANVTNVTVQSGVNVNVNGVNITNFTFNTANGVTTFNVSLIEGANIITVTATNTAGTASETQTIIYRKPVTVQPPVVTFVDPAINPLTVYNAVCNLKARVRYVAGAQQIILRINGQLTSNFVYSASSEIMEFTSGLVPGANSFEITATNAAGTDQKSTTIIYRLPNPAVPPVVTITNPVPNPHTVTTATAPVAATVLNVEGSQNITVLVNSVPVTNFTYNTASKQLDFIMSLVHGSNTVEVKAVNSAGQASDNKVILYRREQLPVPPVVTFINPFAPGSTVNVAGYTVKATALHVNEASQVVVYQNGQTVIPALWYFNPGTKEVTMNTTLNPGNNIFTVTGTNAAGSNTATTTINYVVPVVACDKPVIAFTLPANSGTEVSVQQQMITVSVQNIISVNQIQLIVNGVPQTQGALNGSLFSKQVELVAGQNSIEVIAKNNCGETHAITTVVYKPAAAPCTVSSIQRIMPQEEISGVEVSAVNISASVSHIANSSQLQLTVNGQSVPFSFDAGAHLVTATVNLNIGENNIELTGQNECDVKPSTVSWRVTRTECYKPIIRLYESTVPNGGTTTGSTVAISASVTGVTSNSQITVTLNGTPVGFVFTPQTSMLTLQVQLAVGANTIVVSAQNSCGNEMMRLAINRKEEAKVFPPTITITNPAAEVTNTEEAGMSVAVATTYVTGANQVSVTVNGAPVNFSFNASNGAITFNTVYQPGANVIVATAVTNGGTATDSKTVIYTVPQQVLPPAIVLTSPTRCPARLYPGTTLISGTVTNISSADQVTILINNVVTPFTSTISNNILTFSLEITLSASSVQIPVVINAANAGGKDTESCAITVLEQENSNGSTGTSTPENGGGREGGGKTAAPGPLKPASPVPAPPAPRTVKPLIRP